MTSTPTPCTVLLFNETEKVNLPQLPTRLAVN